MEIRTKGDLAAQKRAYRLWFEYLVVARQSTKKEVKAALNVSQPFYAPWEMNKGEKWNDWWKTHSHLFEEKFTVRELKKGEEPLDPSALIIEVPLTQSPTMLTKKVKSIIQGAFDAREKDLRKNKTTATAYYKLSDRAEPKFDAIREMLSVYRDVYLKNQNLRGEKLLDATHNYYLGRKNKQWNRVPMPLRYDGDNNKIRAMRNLRRYLQKAERIILNVARGQFPGAY